MNEKNNQMPMMYKTNPAVAELNKVPGFDPLKFLRRMVSRKTNEEMLQLALPYQKLWFRLRHPHGCMKVTALRITEQLAIMEAKVYLDRSDAEPISSYISQHSAEESKDYVQAAQDEALSDALSDAGFGLQFADVGIDSAGKVYGSTIPLTGSAPVQQAAARPEQKAVDVPKTAAPKQEEKVPIQTEKVIPYTAGVHKEPAMAVPVQAPSEKAEEQLPVSFTAQESAAQPIPAAPEDNTDVLPAEGLQRNLPVMERQAEMQAAVTEARRETGKEAVQEAAVLFQQEEALPAAHVQPAAASQPVVPRYTKSTPVEEILQTMTFEEARKVVVDTGVCAGKTMDTVAKERPVSLKFYLTPGNRSENNIVRAAAHIMLDSLAAPKAG